MTRSYRALTGVLAAGLLSVPLLTVAIAAPAKKKTAKKPVKKVTKKVAKADPKAGRILFASEGCTGCHKSTDFPQAGTSGPDLSKAGEGHTAKEIAAYIRQPKAGSIMPAYKGPQTNIDSMTAYLLTQK